MSGKRIENPWDRQGCGATTVAFVDDVLTDILDRDRAMLEYFGLEFVDAADGTARLTAVAKAEMLNSHEVAHGGLAFVLADTAAAYAMASLGLRGVTVGSTMAFTAPIRAGRPAHATAEVTARGRTFCVAEASVVSEDTLCATATLRFKVREAAG